MTRMTIEPTVTHERGAVRLERRVAQAGRRPLDVRRRRRRGVPAPAARADPAGARRRGRLRPGGAGLGPGSPTACTGPSSWTGRRRCIALFKAGDALAGPLVVRVAGRAGLRGARPGRGRGGPARSPTSGPPGGPRSRRPPWSPPADRRGRGQGRAARAAVPGRASGWPWWPSGTGPTWLALAAGLLAGLALGLKQSLASGLVFVAVLFVGSFLAAGRLPGRAAAAGGGGRRRVRRAGAGHGRAGRVAAGVRL